MQEYKLFDAEYRFAEIVWELEPVNSTALVRECEKRLGWKKATTYTVLRKLCERGIMKNEQATVTALVKKEAVQQYESEALLEKSFDNSLPAFLAAFLKDKKLSRKEAEEILRMIEDASE
ncbi:MAG: BlaI/MecI/CopY family transcriptional regulator [Eubacteriales bacterium]|nr:BlaI/MecI/CopY family transcriptional regulator [Eubacteriales bacterium]